MIDDVTAAALAGRVGFRADDTTRRLVRLAVARVCRRQGLAPHQAAARVLEGEPGAFRELVLGLTNRETYFYRHPEDFRFVEGFAAAAAARGAPLRSAWSVGCSSGEETYSLAAVLSPHAPDLVVAGCDVCEEALQLGAAGRYSKWSFRDLAPHTQPGLVPSGEGWQVVPALRQRVTFYQTNLAVDPVKPRPPLPPQVDVIFCRNVLIYFEAALAEAVVQALAAAVAPGGLLVLGAVERPLQVPAGFGLVDAGAAGLVLLRAQGSRLTPAPTPASSPACVAPSRSAQPQPSSRVPLPRDALASGLAEAQRLADDGQLDEALRLCGALPETAEVLFLRAAICLEGGDLGRAEFLLRHLLLLVPRHVPALVQLWLMAQRRGDAEAARRFDLALEETLKGSADDAVVGNDGMTAGAARQILAALAVGRAAGAHP